MINDTERHWRELIANRCGGAEFDKPGTGYSFSNVKREEEELMKSDRAGDDSSALLRLSIADPTWKMPESAIMAGVRYYQQHGDATRYKDNNGIEGTHEAIATYLNAEHPGSGVTFDEKWVQHSPGSIKRLLAEYIPSLLFEKGTSLIFPAPGYGVIKSNINRRGAEAHDVSLKFEDGRWQLDYAAINDILRQTRVPGKQTVLYLNMPHNPTGATMGLSALTSLVAWATENDIIVVVDEAYTHLRFDDSPSILDIPGWEECCIVLQSVSKGWNATGLRFGWAVAHPTLIKALRAVTDVKDSGLFGPSIAMGLWCLSNRQFALETNSRYIALHHELSVGLQAAGFESAMPQAGLCQFTCAPRAVNGIEFKDVIECAQYFRKELRISLMNYTVKGQGWLRWAVTIAPVPACGLPDEASVIREAVRRLRSIKLEF